MTHGVAATSGHLASNGGIRGHSAGAVFPFVVYQQGTPSELYHWVLQPNGLRIGPFEKYEQAENLAARLKLTGQLAKDDTATVEAILNPPTHNYYVDSDGLEQKWRWRHPIGAEAHSRAEVTSDWGASWTKSGHTVRELRGEVRGCTFRSIGTDPLWPSNTAH